MIRCLSFVIAIAWQVSTLAQGLSGTVRNEDHDAVVGAHVLVNDQLYITDGEGIFQSAIPSGMVRIRVQAIGFEEFEEVYFVASDTSIQVVLRPHIYSLDMVELQGSWIKPDQPFANNQISGEGLQKLNNGRDVPFLLENMPSAVVTSDAGTGIGYTGIRIRGTDATRINVTIDGVPLNDAESQGVFWVDLPDIAGNADAIQVQRGVGTSTNGAGAFGGTINVRTALNNSRYGSVDLNAGSFGTFRSSLKFGSGKLGDHFFLQGSGSLIRSNGYIDRASSNLKSLYLSTRYVDDKQSLKVNLLRGHEVTYQAWNGVPYQYIEDSGLRTYNSAGIKRDGSFHDNEVDNYGQTHLHLIYNRQLSGDAHLRTVGHYTKGAGYFEQFRSGDLLEDYGLSGLETDDLIRRRWLDNDFVGLISTVHVAPSEGAWNTTLGGGLNHYLGRHFGEVIWADNYMLQGRPRYYENRADKLDFNIFGQYQWQWSSGISLFTDLQYRGVWYDFEGPSSTGAITTQQVSHSFFNPKAGINYQNGPTRMFYSVAIAHREPNRDDYVQSTPESRPEAERLVDHELGMQYEVHTYSFGMNLFSMIYHDQLILTGAINDVGEYNRVNVPRSSRSGVEAQFGWEISPVVRWEGNFTWNRSRIKRLDEAIDNWDTGEQVIVARENVPISFSPEWTGYTGLTALILDKPRHQLSVAINHKYVGKQYLDNSGRTYAALPSFANTSALLSYEVDLSGLKKLRMTMDLVNILNTEIVSNGWIYRYISDSYDARSDDPHARLEEGSIYNLTGYYPQAGRHVFFGVSLQF